MKRLFSTFVDQKLKLSASKESAGGKFQTYFSCSSTLFLLNMASRLPNRQHIDYRLLVLVVPPAGQQQQRWEEAWQQASRHIMFHEDGLFVIFIKLIYCMSWFISFCIYVKGVFYLTLAILGLIMKHITGKHMKSNRQKSVKWRKHLHFENISD